LADFWVGEYVCSGGHIGSVNGFYIPVAYWNQATVWRPMLPVTMKKLGWMFAMDWG